MAAVVGGSTPVRLQPLRSNKAEFRFQDLRGEKLTPSEKLWLCKEVESQNVATAWSTHTKKGLTRRYNLYPTFFQKNWPSFKNGDLKAVGGPAPVSQKYIDEIKDKIMAARLAVKPIDEAGLRVLLNEAAAQTNMDRRHPDPAFVSLCKRSVDKLLSANDMRLRSVQSIQVAQLQACKDPFMSYMWYLICLACSGKLSASQKWNADATTFVFQPPGKGGKVVTLLNEKDYIIDAEDTIKLKSEIKSTKAGSGLPFAIKMMEMIGACGACSDLVLIVAIKEMGKDDWLHVDVKGMGTTCEIGSSGHVYFSKTRCGTGPMWKDWLTRVAVPTMEKSSAHFDAKDENGNPEVVFFSTDGEEIILRNGFDPEVKERMEAAAIHWGRVAAGTTRIHNANDRSSEFRDAHREIKTITKNSVDVSNDLLEKNIRGGFAALKTAFPDLSIGAGFVDNIVRGILTVLQALGKVRTPGVIRRSFTICGQHCPPDANGYTVDFEKMMAQCYSDVPRQQLDLMKLIAAELVSEYVMVQGRVPFDKLVEHGIHVCATTLNRDNLALVRHSSEIITHDTTMERFAEWKRTHAPEFIAQQKQATADDKVIARADKSDAKAQAKADKKAASDEAKAAEKTRRDGLTKEEKKAEDTAKKADAATAKTAKADKRKAAEDARSEIVAAAKMRRTDIVTL